MTPRPHCEDCEREIDPETCWCGNDIKHSAWNEGHEPVPMGCICHYARENEE